MSKKNKVVLALSVSMTFGTAVYGTHAYFLSKASSDTAVITAKTLKIERSTESRASALTDAEPSKEGKGALIFKVQNSGQMDASITYTLMLM